MRAAPQRAEYTPSPVLASSAALSLMRRSLDRVLPRAYTSVAMVHGRSTGKGAASGMENSVASQPAPPANGADVLIRTVGLSKAFGMRLAVNGVNLDVRRGDVFGLLGP